MLEHVQSTGLSLLNQIASDGENYVEEDNNFDAPPQVKVWGCKECGCIFNLSTYFVPGMESYNPRCPRCGEVAELLGWMPYIIEEGNGVYLMDKTGRTTGPHRSTDEAREHLWDWFDKEGTNGEEENHIQKKSIRKGCFRLVSSEGILLEGVEGYQEDGGQEDFEKGALCKEGAEGRAKEKAVEETGCSSSCRSCDEGDGGRDR